LHGVVFDIFVGSHSVAKCRAISAQTCEPKVVFPFAVQRIGDFAIELTTRSVF